MNLSPPASPEQNEAIRALKELLKTLEYAQGQIREILHQARLRRLYRNLLHPIALFLACMAIGLLMLVGMFVVWRSTRKLPTLFTLQWVFSASALLYYIPVILWSYRGQGQEDWQPMLWEIYRADEIVLEQGWEQLLNWPGGHPEQIVEELRGKKRLEALERAFQSRKEQIQGRLSMERTIAEGQAEVASEEEA